MVRRLNKKPPLNFFLWVALAREEHVDDDSAILLHAVDDDIVWQHDYFPSVGHARPSNLENGLICFG
ncbi:hypothetical protein AWB67_05783 [Caballeronia terrestris]|uniref:Uncharacterized protein n=1 Tax=Caballeronia terrestris TaxID=1226301 RepID=A0A158KJ91_9BURK|nr:hypothetical protein AWB67_05783 [Caballeronia terrestris]